MCEGHHPKNNWDRMYETECGSCKYLLARHREFSLGFSGTSAERMKARTQLKVWLFDVKAHFTAAHPEWLSNV